MERNSVPRLLALYVATGLTLASLPASGQEVVVLGGLEETIGWLERESWWGAEKHGEQLQVPHAMITGISENWSQNANKLPVAQKKEIFYRFMLPLILHANEMVRERRARLETGRQALQAGRELSTTELEQLRHGAVLLRIRDADAAAKLGGSKDELLAVIDEMLYRLDVIPNGLVLGQAAYESGYATSRFAAEGNALFGQWTYGGEGLVPEQQRKHLGDHRIASYDWPFDSVRGYFLNLSSHPAYEGFRRLRAELKAAGKPLTSLALADGLSRYSERGQEYVDTLKGIIRTNRLDIADDAAFRDEPTRFVMGAGTPENAARLRRDIEDLRRSGELARIVERMRLD